MNRGLPFRLVLLHETLRSIVPPSLSMIKLLLGPDRIVLVAQPTAPGACPRCDVSSRRVHSQYMRQPADLPWHGRVVGINIHARRFRCDHPTCSQRIFVERLPDVRAHPRRTVRLGQSQLAIGLATGGEPGSRLARKLAMPVSGDTLLRMIHAAGDEAVTPPRVVSIDDWARRKGQRYGTIVCDLERNRVIDLLPERTQRRHGCRLASTPSRHPGGRP